METQASRCEPPSLVQWDANPASSSGTGSYITLLLQEQEVTSPCFYRNRKLLYPASTGTGSYFALLLQEQEVTLPCFYRNRRGSSPEGGAEAAGHVVPEEHAVHGADQHVDCLDDLRRVLVLLHFASPQKMEI